MPRIGPRHPAAGPPALVRGVEDALAESESERQTDHTRIEVRGELDLDTIHVLAEALTAADGPVVIDLHRVAFADCTLVHALLGALPHHELTLTDRVPTQVHRLLDATGTRHRFTFSPAA
ncbi:STAS domain-containing protein [Streptomyces virginiae]